MNFPRISLWCALPIAAPLLASLAGGCAFIPDPPLKPAPTPVPTPFGIQFDPSEGSKRGTTLNKLGDATLPDAFRIAQVVSGEEVVLQTIDTAPGAVPATVSAPVATTVPTTKSPIRKTGAVPSRTPGATPIVMPTLAPGVVLGVADPLNPVKLAGIVVPTGSQTGAAEAAATLNNWTIGQDLDVDIDPVFPTNTDNKRRVQILFKGRDGKDKGKLFSLNRMMVRSGYAIVDLYSPTSFDQQQWLYDEAYARENNLGLWKTNVFRTLQQRVKLPSTGTGAKSRITLTLPKPGDLPTVTAPAAIAPDAATTTGSEGSSSNSAMSNSMPNSMSNSAPGG